MNTDVAIRAALERRASHFEAPAPVSIDEIAVGAVRRQRRSRLNGVLVTLIVAVLVSVGVGSALRDKPSDSVFAAETTEGAFEDENLELSQAIFDGERYVGLATDGAIPDEDQADEFGQWSFAVATSVDGESWHRVADSPIFTGKGVVLAGHDGEYVVVSTRVPASDQESNDALTQELVMAMSDDLVDWQEQRQPVDGELTGEDDVLRPVDIAMSDAGVMVETQSVPAFNPQMDEYLESLGYEMASLCDQIWESSKIRFRECGTTERITVDIGVEFGSWFPFEQQLFLAPPGGQLAQMQPPSEDYWRPRPGRTLVYATDSGFGLQGPETYESNDGQVWTQIETPGEQGVMVAARGADRVFRSEFPFPTRRLGAGNQLWGMGFRSGDGEWEEIGIDQLYPEQTDSPRWFADLQSGPAGWTLIAQRSFMTRPDVPGVERSRTGASDFTLTAGSGHVLTGTYPFGPAVLFDPGGTALQRWDQLEVENPEWSGLRIDGSGVSVLDPATDENLVTFTLRQWSALIDPLGFLEYDLLFSADGRNWEILKTYPGRPTVLTTGAGELVVRASVSMHYAFFDTQVGAVPVNQRD